MYKDLIEALLDDERARAAYLHDPEFHALITLMVQMWPVVRTALVEQTEKGHDERVKLIEQLRNQPPLMKP